MASGDYGDNGTIKDLLDVDQANTKYDDDINFSKEAGNRFVDDLLYIHAATLPLTGDQKESAGNVCNFHACVIFKTRQNATKDIIQSWKDLRDEAKEALIAKLKAQPDTNTQSQAVAYASSYRTEPITSRET